MGRKVVRVDINLLCEALDLLSSNVERRASDAFKNGTMEIYQKYTGKLAKCRELKRRLSETVGAAAVNSLTSNPLQRSSGHKASLPADEVIQLNPINSSPVRHCPYCYCSNVKEMHMWERTQVDGKAYNFQKGFDCGYVAEIKPHGQVEEVGRCNSRKQFREE